MSSTIDKLRTELDEMRATLAELISHAPIHHADWGRREGVVVIAPDYYFNPLSPDCVAAQLVLKRRYERWLERLTLVVKSAPDQLARELKSADEHFRMGWNFKARTGRLSPTRVTTSGDLRSRQRASCLS